MKAEAFAEKIGPPDENGCLPWFGAKGPKGYGIVKVKLPPAPCDWRAKYERRSDGGLRINGPPPPEFFDVDRKQGRSAHSWAWQLANGPIPEGYQVHHTCGNTSCVNHEHLLPVTVTEHARLHAG